MSGVVSSPALATCEKSQVLLARVPGGNMKILFPSFGVPGSSYFMYIDEFVCGTKQVTYQTGSAEKSTLKLSYDNFLGAL